MKRTKSPYTFDTDTIMFIIFSPQFVESSGVAFTNMEGQLYIISIVIAATPAAAPLPL